MAQAHAQKLSPPALSARDELRVADPGPEHRLYRAVLDLLRCHDDPSERRHVLFGPLSQTVARQKTREGQQLCAGLAEALAARDHDRALDACLALIDLANALAPQG